MSSLNLTKVSELMSPLERAKLIISMELKGFGEMDMDNDKRLPVEKEVELIAAACPPSQAREYNFLIRLKGYVWRRLWVMIELHQNYLEILDGRMMLIRFLLVASPALHDCLQIVRKQLMEVRPTGDNDDLDIVTFSKERDVAINYLESMLSVSVDEGNVKLTNPKFKEGLENFKQKFTQTVNDIHGRIAIIKKIEQKHFGGMEIASRDPKHPSGFIPRVLAEIDRIVECHNRHLSEIVENFNLVGMGLIEYHFDQLNEFLLTVDPKVDSEWVEKELVEIEEEERR